MWWRRRRRSRGRRRYRRRPFNSRAILDFFREFFSFVGSLAGFGTIIACNCERKRTHPSCSCSSYWSPANIPILNFISTFRANDRFVRRVRSKGSLVRGLNVRCCCCIFTRYQSVTGRSRNSDRLRYSVADTFCRLHAGSGEYINHLQCVLLRQFFCLPFCIWRLRIQRSASISLKLKLNLESSKKVLRFDSLVVVFGCRLFVAWHFFSLHSIRFIPFNTHQNGLHFQIECNHFGFGSLLPFDCVRIVSHCLVSSHARLENPLVFANRSAFAGDYWTKCIHSRSWIAFAADQQPNNEIERNVHCTLHPSNIAWTLLREHIRWKILSNFFLNKNLCNILCALRDAPIGGRLLRCRYVSLALYYREKKIMFLLKVSIIYYYYYCRCRRISFAPIAPRSSRASARVSTTPMWKMLLRTPMIALFLFWWCDRWRWNR